jgi:hypothetical protein
VSPSSLESLGAQAADLDPFDDDDAPQIPPWDRRPLLVVIASAAVLVLIGIVTGVVSAAMFGRNGPVADWHDAGTGQSPDGSPTGLPGQGPGVAETITLSGVGDVIMGAVGLGEPPNSGSGFFDPVKDALASDLVMGNLESALSEQTGYNKCGPPPHEFCYQFSLPPSYANVLRDGGFQVMTLANNHTLDMGEQGLVNTRAALEAAGIEHTGAVDQITYVDVRGVRVAVLGFSVYSWGASLNDVPRAVQMVQEADAEADLIVIQMQGGAEGSDKTIVPPAGEHEFFVGEDRGDLQGFARAVIDAGADVVFGHGPHVMRGMEFYQGRLIAYSLGNFCGYATLSSAGYSGVGGILKVTLQRDGAWSSGELIATEMVNGGLVALDAERRALSFVDGLSQQNFGASGARVDHTTGAITVPGA